MFDSKRLAIAVPVVAGLLSMTLTHAVAQNDALTYAIAIHGGAGSKPADDADRDLRTAGLNEALSVGETILKDGGTSLDAVEAVIRAMEDLPQFNAGRGAVFNAAGSHELDASIMDGRDRSCGAVAGVRTIRHPITLARRVMTDTRHVLLTADGAETFADELGTSTDGTKVIERVSNDWFSTEEQRQNLKKAQAMNEMPDAFRIGTVGCVALDSHGNIAAGTSTGGLTNKRFGRVGDSPIVGAGTFADNSTCAVSCTGVGEDFIRHAVAFNIAARMEYLGESVEDAVTATLRHEAHKTIGGVIAVANNGEITMQFNTEGMNRAAADSSGRREIFVGE